MRRLMAWLSARPRAMLVAGYLLAFALGSVVEHLGRLLREWSGDALKELWSDEPEDDDEVD